MRVRVRQSGFTLLEMLVVMAIAGLVAGLLFQALVQVAQMQRRFGVEIFRAQRGAMETDWYRNTVAGLMADHDDGQHRFAGRPDRMSGLTLSPLEAQGVAYLPFSWRLQFDAANDETRLLYRTASDQQTVILSWPGRSGQFGYLDARGQFHDQWPPPLGLWPQLPAAVMLQYRQEGRTRQVVAVPQSAPTPLPRLKDILQL